MHCSMGIWVLSVNVAYSMAIKWFQLIKERGIKKTTSVKKETSRLNTVVNNLVPSSGCWCVDTQKGPKLMRRGGSLTFPPRFRPLMSPAGRSLTSGPPAVRADNADPRCTGAGGRTVHIAQTPGLPEKWCRRDAQCGRTPAGSPTLLSHKQSSPSPRLSSF